MFDGKQLGDSIVGQVRSFLERTYGALKVRVEELEKRAPIPGPQGERGPEGVAGRDGADGIQGKDGRDGVDGKDGTPGKDGAPGERGADGAAGRDGINGKDGADGLNGKDGAPGKDGRDGERGEKGADGKDGINGKDGAPGINGKDADEAAIVERVRSLIPTPKDGRDGRDGAPGAEGARGADGINGKDGQDGKDGKDGLSVDDFNVTLDGRLFTFTLGSGENVKQCSIKVPFPFDRGVFRSGTAYEKGDVVTYGGSQWIALADTKDKPPSDSWRCQVQRGRDGKDAE